MTTAIVSTMSISSIDVHVGNSGTTQTLDSVILNNIDEIVV